MHLDTQVVSYAIKGLWNQPLKGCAISSIVANELLLIHGTDLAQANVYVPLLSKAHAAGPLVQEFRRRDHQFNKRLSDSILMDFGNEYPTIIEYNNLSISTAINDGLHDLIAGAINHLGKDTKKTLKKRFRFFIENGIRCVPITSTDVEFAFDLLAKFREDHNLKGKFRNTWNDLLILSTAIHHSDSLVTEDSLLSRFAAQQSGVEPETKHGFLELPFTKTTAVDRKLSNESKGYINNGWRVKFNRPPPSSQAK